MRRPAAGVRAKAGWIVVPRRRKDGKIVQARDHMVTGLGGAYSGKEMEQEMQRIADETGASHSQIRMETYKLGDAPRESDPMRGQMEQFTRTVGSQRLRNGWDRAFNPGGSGASGPETAASGADQPQGETT